jgi:hypothetical protein
MFHYRVLVSLFELLCIKNQNDKIKKDGMGRACSMHFGDEECIYYFGGGARKKRDP